MKVICTAGHVDHGKSSLVRALTGQEPDRLAEEQRRGLTIDLGFAWTDLPQGGRIAFVDLPGHERFVPNMLAGAGPARLCLFVVAADEGWMPQSAEHLTILDLLGVEDGVIALTRSDLADELTTEVAREEIQDAVAGTVLADAPIIEVSAVEGTGLDAVRDALAQMVAAASVAPDLGSPRLWVDRVFSVRGAGTVVTGTLADGVVRPGDDLVIQPSGRVARVRGVQALGEDVAVAEPGWRVAINLVGVDTDDVSRGDAVGGRGWLSTDEAEVWCTPAPSAGPAGVVPIGRRGAWTAHVGTASVPVAVHPTDGTDLVRPGPVRLELASRLPLAVGDRLILRESGRAITAGGAVVLDPAPPPRPRGRDQRMLRAQALESAQSVATPAARLASLLSLHPTLDRDVAGGLARAPVDPLPEGVVAIGRWLTTTAQWTQWAGLALKAVSSEHQRHPARGHVDPIHPRTLLGQAGCPIADEVIGHLVTQDRLERVPGGVRIPGHEARLTIEQQQARLRLLTALDAAGTSPPPLAEAARAADADDDLVQALLADQQLRALPGLHAAVTESTWDGAVKVLTDLATSGGPFTASAARDALGTSRKFVLPLLEAMDEAGVTVRDGDLRRLAGG